MLSRFSKREQDMILFAALSIILFFLIYFILLPALERRQSLTKQIQAKQNALKEIGKLERRYYEIHYSFLREKEMIKRRDRQFTLFSFIDKLAQQSNVKNNVAYMKPSTLKSESEDMFFSNVKVKLDGIIMKQAFDFIYKIETSNNMVNIRSLSFFKSREENKLTAIIDIETIITQ